MPSAAKKAMRIASDACIYTNDNYTSLQIDRCPEKGGEGEG